jgi:4-amino-4-deoxy-L-arabinose transferase-like glycosyltransferase
MSQTRLERVAQWTPLLILLYFAAQILIRVVASANLETDEAQFVGQTHFALGYNNSHPPLYNWLVAGALALTNGSWPVALTLVKNLLLAGTYLLTFDIARQVTGRSLTGLIVAASFLLIPQIVWKSQVTLSHSVLVMFAVVAIMHAIVQIARREGDVLSFVWLGLAATIGAMAKYNLFLMLFAALVAAFSVPDIRRRLFTARLAISALLLALLTAPHFIWAVQNLRQTTQRMVKLERQDPALIHIDLPGIGIDGLVDLLVALATWVGPLMLAWFAIRYATRDDAAAEPASMRGEGIEIFAQFFGRTAFVGFSIFAAIILVGDMHSVRERYLTPLLMPLPFWLAFSWPLDTSARAATRFLAIGAVLAFLMVTAWPLWITFGRDQFAYPYESFTQAVDSAVPGPFAVASHHEKFAANIAIRLDRARLWQEGSQPDKLLILWDAKSARPPSSLIAKLGDRFEPRGDMMAMTFPYANYSGHMARLNAQLYTPKP